MIVLAVAFCVGLVALSVWYAYAHLIGPVREARRRMAYREIEERRARHWQQVGRAKRREQ